MDDQWFLYYLAGIPALGAMAQWLAWRLRLPSILLLLAFGIILGTFVKPDDIFARLAESSASDALGPRLLFPLISLSVAVILFEGGLTLRFSELKEAGSVVLRLVTIGCLVSWIMTTWIGWSLLSLNVDVAALLGAILVVTGPTVVGPLLNHVKPLRRVGSIVKWEGIVIDPIGAVLAVLVFEYVFTAQEHHATHAVWSLLRTVLVGGFIGWGIALVLVFLVRRYLIPDFLHGVAFLTVALGVFAISNWLQPESGLVTVTVLGVLLANQKSICVHHIVEFQENLRVFLISCLFVVLGSRLEINDLVNLGVPGVTFVLLLVILVRPLSVFVATFGSTMKWNERTFLALLAPRGIVAAAVISVFALELASHVGNPALQKQADRLVPITFMVILGTVTIYGIMARPVALWLKVADPDPQGIAFGGAEPWIREIAKAIHSLGVQVMLVDTNYSNVAAARMSGLNAECCSVLSEHVRENLDLAGIGRLLAMTANDEVNTLAVQQFTYIFGRRNVYQLPPADSGSGPRQSVSHHLQGRVLFSERSTHEELLHRFETGATIKTTSITDEFTYDHFKEMHGETARILFVMDESQRLRVCVQDVEIVPEPGSAIVAIVGGSSIREQS